MCVQQALVLFFGLLLLVVAGQVLVTPSNQNAYVSHREETWKFWCSASDNRGGTLHWELSQELENRTTTRGNNADEIELEISPPRAEVTINISCIYKLESGETFSSWGLLNVKVVPFFKCEPENQVLHRGHTEHIVIPTSFEDSESTVICKKNGQDLDNEEYEIKQRGSELVIHNVQNHHAGDYNCRLNIPYPLENDQKSNLSNVTFTVHVEDARPSQNITYLGTVGGNSETLSCKHNGIDYEWRAITADSDGKRQESVLINSSLSGRVTITADRHDLQLTNISTSDFETQFVCVTKMCSRNRTHATILLHRELLELCVKGEDNKRILTKRLKEVLRGFDERCSHDADAPCLVTMTDVSYTRQEIDGEGFHKMSATVDSKVQVVKLLNAILDQNGQYKSQGLTILICNDDSTSTDDLNDDSTPTPDKIITDKIITSISVIASISVIGVLMTAVVIAVCIYKMRSHRNAESDAEAQRSTTAQPCSCAMGISPITLPDNENSQQTERDVRDQEEIMEHGREYGARPPPYSPHETTHHT